MIKTDLHPQAFGSEHDTVLAGVARGLHDLFPPIHNLQNVDATDESPGASRSRERGQMIGASYRQLKARLMLAPESA